MAERRSFPVADRELPECWAETDVSGNGVRQLLIAGGDAQYEQDEAGADWVVTSDGKWPVLSASTATADGRLGLVLPRAGRAAPKWVNVPKPGSPEEILESLDGCFHYREGNLAGTRKGLRPPQLGAVHAVLGYWASAPSQPATVVMPTGTGKTDSMIALFAAHRPRCLLVVVPTDALRTQIAGRFQTYGVLPAAEVLDAAALRPIVGTIKHRITSTAEAIEFAQSCNVIVATISVLARFDGEVLEALVSACSHLFVDEAHHIAATQWNRVRDRFQMRDVVQFTATPFRADGKHLGGRLIFSFPLREAQKQGYYSKIDYIPVTSFSQPDIEIAQHAIARLRADLTSGYDHLVMARVSTIKRAKELVELYGRLAPDLAPVAVHSELRALENKQAIKAVNERASRIIVCVDMLGEGYDLPSLKIAAIHDPHKTLPVTLQFIGRFARATDELGDACVIVRRPDPEYDESLRQLYANDADWNLIISDLSEATIGRQQAASDLEAGFGSSLPDEVPIRALEPKMSTVIYRTACLDWHPEEAARYFGEDRLLTPSVAVNRQRNLAWLVTEERTPVRWGTLKTVEETSYNLYVLYWDSERNLLYINSSNTDGVYKKLAEAVCDDDAEIIRGEQVYRVMARINRLVPTNVGLIDVRSRARRFSMHVGADVSEGFPTVEAQTKTKTNIFATGYEDGRAVSFGGSLKGRVWSRRAARSLAEWVEWCDHVGAKIIDAGTSVDEVMRGFIRPQEVRERPALMVLAVDWPIDLYFDTTERTQVSLNGSAYPLHETELQLDEVADNGPVMFSVVTPGWRAQYEATFSADGIAYRAVGSEVAYQTARTSQPLVDLFSAIGVSFYFESETTIEHGGFLLRPPRNTPPFLREKLTVVTWTGVNIRKESQRAERAADSIQRFVIDRLRTERQWDVVIDDDGSGEAADIVALAVEEDMLLIRLVHCKYSSKETGGARVKDLYEVCGQAQKSVRWKDARRLIAHLIGRERRRQVKHGRTGFEVGNETVLTSLQDQARTLRPRMQISIAQPGLSAATVRDEQLHLLACTEVYLHETASAQLDVLCGA